MLLIEALGRPLRSHNQTNDASINQKVQADYAVRETWSDYLKRTLYRTVKLSAHISDSSYKSLVFFVFRSEKEHELAWKEVPFTAGEFV